jgi:hypothetical protein
MQRRRIELAHRLGDLEKQRITHLENTTNGHGFADKRSILRL